jgi:hypothetical protein
MADLYDQYRQLVLQQPPPAPMTSPAMAGQQVLQQPQPIGQQSPAARPPAIMASPNAAASQVLANAPPQMAGPSQLDKDKAALEDLKKKGSGEAQLYHKIAGSQFGQNHPFLGKLLGGAAAGLTGAGDIALSTLGGGMGRLAAEMIPGTMLHHQVEVNRGNRDVTQDEANAEKEAQTAGLQADIPLRQAQAQKAQAEATALPGEQAEKKQLEDAQIQNLLHPQAKTAFEDWRHTHPTDPTEDFFRAEQAAKPVKGERPDTPEQQFIDEYQKTHPNPNGSVADAIHAYAAATQKPERGPTIIQQNSEVDKMAGRLAKPYQTAYDKGAQTQERIELTRRNVDAGYVGQGLAIPELITSLVSGQGTGIRVTQAELNAITANRGIKGDAESWFNSIAGKGKLTDTDKKQIKGVLADAETRLQKKIAVNSGTLDAINGAGSREDVVAADKAARQHLNEIEKYGFYEGERLPNGGTVVGFNNGKVQVNQ